MPSYLIGYDLNKSGQDYAALIEAIEALSEYRWHCLDSTWIVKHPGTAAVIRDTLTQHIDKNDELLVVKLSGEGAWRGFSEQCSVWLKNHLK